MGSEHVNTYESGGGAALRGLNWPHKRHAIDDASLAELGAGMAEGAAASAEQVDAGGIEMIATAQRRKFVGAELLERAFPGVLMSLLKEED